MGCVFVLVRVLVQYKRDAEMLLELAKEHIEEETQQQQEGQVQASPLPAS